MKKINLITSSRRFQEGFEKECEARGITLCKVQARRTVVHVKDNEDPRFVYKNEFVDIKGGLNFFQMRGYESFVPTMITKYIKGTGLYLHDAVNTEHTQEGLRKMMQMLLLNMHNLPIPESIIFNSFSYETNKEYILENVSFPLVLKGEGDKGDAVWKIDTLEDLEKRIVLTEEQKKEVERSKNVPIYLVQEYIPNTHDFRVTMFDGEVLGVIKRSSKDGFYNNYCKGADWEQSSITEEEEKLSKEACVACDVDLAGVDFVRTEDGIKFFEVNKSPMVNVDYSKDIVRLLDERYLSE
jgi:RimK family alpha-L-glutamate ligase